VPDCRGRGRHGGAAASDPREDDGVRRGRRDRRTAAGAEAGSRPARARFGPEPIALFPLVLCLLGALPAAATWPALVWVPLLPLLAAVWVLRARVVVTPEALVVCNGLRRRRVPWERVEGFDVPRRGVARLLHDGGHRTALTAVPRRELGRLVRTAEALGGPGTAATSAAGDRPSA
jgi:hypothetical protein